MYWYEFQDTHFLLSVSVREISGPYFVARHIDELSSYVTLLFQLLLWEGRAAQVVKQSYLQMKSAVREWKMIGDRCEHLIGLYGRITPQDFMQ